MSGRTRGISRAVWPALALLVACGAGGAAWWLAGPSAQRPPAPRPPAAPPRAEPKAEPAPPGPAVWAVVVGVDRYQDQAIPACRGAVADAAEVARWFRRQAGWGEDHVLLLVSEGAPSPGSAGPLEASRANLDWAVSEWLARRVRPEDVVVISFAGQAMSLPGADGVRLLPSDARASDPARTGWAPDEALDALATAGRNPIVLWLDTSPAGRVRGLDPGADRDEVGQRWLQVLTRWPGTSAWLASGEGPAAEAPAPGRRSPFAAALLQGLGTAERPRDLLACLDALNHDRALAGQGFRARGGIAPGLDLWSGRVRLRSDAGRHLLLQRAHAGAVTAVAFTADGARMITAGADSTVRVWRPADRMLLRALTGHLVGVTALALGPGGRLLATGDGVGQLRLWDLADGRVLPAGPPHEAGVDELVFFPDGSRFASLDRDGRAWLWEAADPARPPKALGDNLSGLSCAPVAGPIALVLAQADGKIQLLDERAEPIRTLDGPGEAVVSRALATDGRRVAFGDGAGHLQVWTAEGAGPSLDRTDEAGIDLLRFAPDGSLAVVTGAMARRILLSEDDQPGPAADVSAAGPIRQVVFADDGRWMAVGTMSGGVAAWRLDGEGPPRPIPLTGADETGAATALGVAPGGRVLVAGDQDGGLRAWDLPDGTPRPRIAPKRGQVEALGVSDDGRYLLQVNHDRIAQVWDLAEGRGPETFDGRWAAGAISPDGALVALLDAESGDVVAFDRDGARRRPTTFPRPPTEGVPCRFGVVAFSRDPHGRHLAAGSVDGPLEGPVVCVWEAETGMPVQTFRGHLDPHPIRAVDFAPDGRRLLSASEDGTARVWDLAGPEPTAGRVLSVRDEATGQPVALTAAVFDPSGPGRVVAGGLDGRIRVWGPDRDEPEATLEIGPDPIGIRALALTRDGRWLAAAGGAETAVRLWAMGPRPQQVRLTPAPHHAERVNALVAWPDGSKLASGSDDTTIRLWGLADRRLLGTLSADPGTPDWVVYTPEGLFDSSAGGEAQVTWLQGEDVLPLDQFYDRAHLFGLAARLRRGEHPEAPRPPTEPPPRLSIDPPAREVTTDREAELVLSLGSQGLEDVRLYQDGVPIRGGADLPPDGRVRVPVHLRPGLNRFYAMAARPGAIDGRSNVVEIRLEAPELPGRLHVLALGVSDYRDNDHRLRFADGDAEEIAEFLHRHGIPGDGERGVTRVLTNEEVSEAHVEGAFRAIRDAVAGRPQDTVVVFLAGHTDVLARRFHLLLPGYAFPREAGAGDRPLRARPGTVLPFVTIARDLARLDALNRLVVVDACRAESLLDDPGVRLIRQLVDDGAHRSRTAYLLAARRGEPANEAAALEHGLLTYVLLRGLGRSDLRPVPGETIFDELKTADRDGDGVVLTDELRRYADLTLPRLAGHFPELVQRAGGPALPADPAATAQIQAAAASFPLVVLPRDPAEGPSSASGP